MSLKSKKDLFEVFIDYLPVFVCLKNMNRLKIQDNEDNVSHLLDESVNELEQNQYENHHHNRLANNQFNLIVYGLSENGVELLLKLGFGVVHHVIVGWFEIGAK